MRVMLLNNGGFGSALDTVKFSVEVEGELTQNGKSFRVERDELVRVGLTSVGDDDEWIFWAGTEAVTLADFRAIKIKQALEYAVKTLQHEIDNGRMPKMLEGVGMGLFEDALK
jgi:hypothetical protein